MRLHFRIMLACAGLALGSLVGGCAGLSTATKAIQQPAIIATELGIQALIRAEAAKADKLSPDQARAKASAIVEKMNALQLGRLAYDAALRPNDSEEQQRAVDAVRAQTDAAAIDLLKRLNEIGEGPQPTSAPVPI